MKDIVLHHGSYAHGTQLHHGTITAEDLNEEANNKEYALRPVFGDACWKALLPFRVGEHSL
jgi:hypothetical protein